MFPKIQSSFVLMSSSCFRSLVVWCGHAGLALLMFAGLAGCVFGFVRGRGALP